MGAMTVAVSGLAGNKGNELLRATTETRMFVVYAGIDDIGTSASTGRIFIRVALFVFLAVGDASEAPGCLVIFNGDVAPASSALDSTIFFNVFNLIC